MRVVIAEDAALLREGLIRLLQDRGHTICAAVPDGAGLLAAVAEHRPDAAVVDIRMPPTHTDEGLRAALELRKEFPGTGVLLFSQYIETSYTAQLLEGGAAGVGYLLKDRVANVAEFAAALERVAAGGTALDPEVVSQLFRASPAARRAGLADPAGTPGARADGRRPVELRYRRGSCGLGRGGREARGQHLQQARPAARRQRQQPPRPRRPALPGVPGLS